MFRAFLFIVQDGIEAAAALSPKGEHFAGEDRRKDEFQFPKSLHQNLENFEYDGSKDFLKSKDYFEHRSQRYLADLKNPYRSVLLYF